MSSRMEKYENLSASNMSRTKRNEHIYNSSDVGELSRIKTNTNVSIISDGQKTIDLEKIKEYIYSVNNMDEEYKKRISLELPKEEETIIVRKQEKDYDINSILEKARDNREIDYEEERHRKINNTQIDILKSIKIRENNTPPQDELDDLTSQLNTEEKTIVDLIENIQNNKKKKDLFEDLMGDDENTAVLGAYEEKIDSKNIKEALLNITQDLEDIKEPENDFTKEIKLEMEKMKQQEKQQEEEMEELDEINDLDSSFYTSSISFDKSDFEGLDDLENNAKKSSFFTKLAIFFIVIILFATIFLIVNSVFDLNII